MSDIPKSQYTQTFLELLGNARQSLVISTYQARKLVLLRVQGEHINTHFVDMEKPMGVAYRNGRLSVGTANRVVDYFNSTSALSKMSPGHSNDGAFLPRRTHVTGDIDIHEMAFDGSGELWMVNTRMSCLCTLDVTHSFVPRWRPPFVSGYDATDRCHLNGLAMRSGKPKYVTALGVADEAAGWRRNKAAGGVVIDIDSNKIVASGLSMPHSPRWYQDRLWVLESGAGLLITIDIETGEKTTVAEVPGFCRGIDFIGRYAVLGLSQVRETAMFAGLPLTQRKEDRQCGVWIVDIVTGKPAGYLCFDSGVEEIFSVQCLPMRHPALLDFDDPLLDTSYSVPESILAEFVPATSRQVKADRAREYHQQHEYVRAIALYESILEEEPENIEVQFGLGHALSKCNEWDRAIGCLDAVVAAQDNHAQAWHARGHYHAHEMNFERALENYDKAIAIDRQFASAHYHKACIQLVLGDFKAGLPGLEWRTRLPGFKPINLPHPSWQGENIHDKTLLVVTESDIGNSIQFARYLPLARARCKKLVVVCEEPLRVLFSAQSSVDEVRLHGELPIALFDCYIAIGSLGALLPGDANSIPTKVPYLEVGHGIALPELDDARHTIAARKNIGLLWSDRQHKSKFPDNALNLQDLIVLTDIPDVEFYSFQRPVLEEESILLEQRRVINLEPAVTDLAQTAALMRQMDLMVCVSSTMAHLSGALGLPTILLLDAGADWRWKDVGGKSVWYPSVSVLRRAGSGDWAQLVAQCRNLIPAQVNL